MCLCHVPPDADQGWDDQIVLAAEAAAGGTDAPCHGAVLVTLVEPTEASGALVHQNHRRAESVPGELKVGLETAAPIHFDDKYMVRLSKRVGHELPARRVVVTD